MTIQERESYEIRGSHTENRPPFEGFFKKPDGFYERRGGIS